MAKGEIFIDGQYGRAFMFWCPGCKGNHMVTIEGPNEGGAKWIFTGDVLSPTIRPSIRVNYGHKVCHSYVTAGTIQFLDDCFHTLKGQTVDLPDYE